MIKEKFILEKTESDIELEPTYRVKSLLDTIHVEAISGAVKKKFLRLSY